MAETQTIVQVHKHNVGHPEEAARVTQGPMPQPGQGQVLVLVLVQLRPVNPADLFSCQGVYPGFAPENLPAMPGLEGMGVVAKCGPGASKYKEGQRVTAAPFPARAGNGTWQQFVVVDEGALLAVPDKVSDEAAAQFLVNPVTGFGFFDCLKVPQGGWLLSNAASSTLGRMVIQLAKHYGVRTINLVRSSHHVEDLKKLGADEVIVSTEEDVVPRVKDITGGEGAYATLECVGGDETQKLVQVTRDGGMVLLYGAMAAFDFKSGIPDLLFRHAPSPCIAVAAPGSWCSTAAAMCTAGSSAPPAGTHFKLEEVQEEIRETQAPQRGGKCLEG